MEKVLLGVLVGGGLGGLLGFVGNEMNKKKKEVNDMGYDWKYVKADQDMTESLYSLKSFQHIDPPSYEQIGESCNKLVSLWFLVIDPNSSPQHSWTYTAFSYITKIEELLKKISMEIPNARVAMRRDAKSTKSKQYEKAPPPDPKSQKKNPLSFLAAKKSEPKEESETKSTNMYEFIQCADALCRITQNYYHNIINEMQHRYTSNTNDEWNFNG